MTVKQKMYRERAVRQNPLTGDWFVDLGEPYGAYFGTLAGIKGIIDRYWKMETAK